MPVADDEAFWIALDLTGGASAVTLSLSVELGGGSIREIPAFRVPAHVRVSGFLGPDATLHCFARTHNVDVAEACNRLLLRMDTRSGEAPLADVVIRLVDYAIFNLESGKAPPSSLDVNAGYGGWRMP